MKSILRKLSLMGLGAVLATGASAQIYSFEGKEKPEGWAAKRAKMSLSKQRYKLGNQSLKLDWKPKATLTLEQPQGLKEASRSRNGGLATWVYNEVAVADSMQVLFQDKEGVTQARLPISLNFTGWRCIWVKFQEDLGMKPRTTLEKAVFEMPTEGKGGSIYFDYFAFEKTVSWQRMSDFQYTINRTDFALVHDLLGYRRNQPEMFMQVFNEENQQAMDLISKRLQEWYLGTGAHAGNSLVETRRQAEADFVKKGLKKAEKIQVAYAKDGTPIGKPLFPLYATKKVEGEKLMQFMDINKEVLLPLAFDYLKEGNKKSLEKAHYIYDWMHDQGWADGSAVGTLCFEKLRTAGYFHSWSLLQSTLPADKQLREQNTMNWHSLFGYCYNLHDHPGEVADNLRALALPKLAYALSLKGSEREAAMAAYHNYINLSLGIAPGFFGTIKPDYSGYHHRSPYNSAYYPHALYAGSLIAYLLHDTPYALSAETMEHLKQALLSFRFFSANLQVPASTTGRFPTKQTILQDLVPAMAYVSLATGGDQELLSVMKRVVDNHPQEVEDYFKQADSNLSYTASMGEAEAVAEALSLAKQAEKAPEGSKFMPYSGLLVTKNAQWHMNVKGVSRYIWDFESSSSENLLGRYSSYGHVELFNLPKDISSTHWREKAYNWNYIPGTTTKVLSTEDLIKHNGKKLHRCFTDQSFLAGVAAGANSALFSFQFHDITYDKSFRANKSVVTFDKGAICLGSNIVNDDQAHNSVTTLMQAPNAVEKVMENEQGAIYLDPVMEVAYVVVGASPVMEQEGGLTRLYINHGKSPKDAMYHYVMLPQSELGWAKELLAKNEAYEIKQLDAQAHRVFMPATQTTYAALYDTKFSNDQDIVSSVNIPLAYIATEQGAGDILLTICEPDFRRRYRTDMNKLKDKDVTDVSKPHQTVVTLNGLYELSKAPASAEVKQENGKTILTVTTCDAKNEQFLLKKVKP